MIQQHGMEIVESFNIVVESAVVVLRVVLRTVTLVLEIGRDSSV